MFQVTSTGIAWLKHANAHSHDIYVRPVGSVGLLLLDDLTAEVLPRMQREGFAPTVVVETSPHNFQAWVRVSTTPIAAGLATAAAKGGEKLDIDMNGSVLGVH